MSKITPVLLKQKVTKQGGPIPVYLRIEGGNRRKYVSLRLSVREKDWNPKNHRVRKSHRNADEMNAIISDAETAAEKVALKLRVSGRLDTADTIKEGFIGVSVGDFFAYAYKYLDGMRAKGQEHSFRNLRSAVNKYRDFAGGGVLAFEEMTPESLRKFDVSLVERGNGNNTRAANFAALRLIVRAAVRDGACEVAHDPFSRFKSPRKIKSQKVKLSREEITKLESVDLENSNERLAADLFLFAYYTWGARFSDVLGLKRGDIQGDHIRYVTSKSKKPLSVPIHPKAAEIIERYRIEGEEDYLLFPPLREKNLEQKSASATARILANQRVNKNLKQAVRRAGIKKRVTFHCARHSFAAMAATSGLSIWDLQNSLGHTDASTTDAYVRDLDVSELGDRVSIAYGQ